MADGVQTHNADLGVMRRGDASLLCHGRRAQKCAARESPDFSPKMPVIHVI